MSNEKCRAGHLKCIEPGTGNGMPILCSHGKLRLAAGGTDHATCGTPIGQECKEAPQPEKEEGLSAPECFCDERNTPHPQCERHAKPFNEKEFSDFMRVLGYFHGLAEGAMERFKATLRAKDEDLTAYRKVLTRTEAKAAGLEETVGAMRRAAQDISHALILDGEKKAEAKVKELEQDVYDAQHAVGVLERKSGELEAENERLRNRIVLAHRHLNLNSPVTAKDHLEAALTPNHRRRDHE